MRDVRNGYRQRLPIALIGIAASLLLAGTALGSSASADSGAKRKLAQRSGAADKTAPSKPGRLSVFSVTVSSLTITWRRSNDRGGVAGYTIYRDGVRVGGTNAATTRYVVPALSCGTSYLLAVEAYDLDGNRSSRATIVAATSACMDRSPPSAPPNVAGFDVTASSITVSWGASTDDFGVVGYEVLRDGAPVGSTASTLFALTALQCGTLHTVGVRAFDAAGNRSPTTASLFATAGCPDTSAPSAPAALAVASVTETSISVRWSPSGDDRGVLGYSVYRGSERIGSTDSTAYTVAGLSCGTSHAITVDAYDAAGNRSARSSITAATNPCPPTPDTTPPSTPPGLTVSGTTASAISVRWTAATDDTGVAGYGLYRDNVAAGSVSVPSATFSGLACGRSYQLAVDAYDRSGNRSGRSTLTASTAACPDTAPPSAPSQLTATGTTESAVGIDWVASSDNVGVAGYGIYLGGVRIASTSSPGYTVAALSCGSTYTVGVDAYDAAGSRSPQATLLVATRACPADAQAPTVPQNRMLAGVTQSSFTLSWSAASDNVGVTGYAVFLDGARAATISATSYTYTALACGTTYTIGVQALDAAGNTSDLGAATRSASTSACPGDMQAPSVPAGLTATSTSTSALSVSWSAASDNVGVAGYGYYLGGSLVGNGTGTSYTFAGLVCGTGYTLGVDAFDAAGNRSGRASFSAATSACPPPPPAGELTPPARARTIVNAPSGTTVENDTYYRDPQGTLRYPNDLQRVTVTGAKNMPNYVRNWRDVWVEGKPGEPMNLGPATNQDLMQIKRYPDSAPTPENLTFRYFRMHDLTRTDSTHTDGLQLMAGKNIRFLDGTSENVDVQPFFMRDGGPNTGGGPIEDILFQRITVTGTSGYYTFRVSGDNEETNGYVPTRVKIIDCAGDKPVSIDAAAARRGSETINYRRL